MPTKVKAKSTKRPTKRTQAETSTLLSGASILFAGAAVVLLGNIQDRDNIKLLMIGFGAALLVLGGVLVGMCTKPARKK